MNVAGINSNDIAIISAILQFTEPTAFPIAIPVLPCDAAMEDTSISGRVVARLTIVAPMMNVGMPETSAIQLAASTNQSPPFTTSRMPIARRTTQAAVLPSTDKPDKILDTIFTLYLCAYAQTEYNKISISNYISQRQNQFLLQLLK